MVALFLPCYVEQFAPQVAVALTRLLDHWGVAWHYPAAQTCCGQFAFNAGSWGAARRLRRHFLEVFAAADLILCPGASCVLTVRQHYRKLDGTKGEHELWSRVKGRLVEFSEWLAARGPQGLRWRFPQRVLWQQSCSARRLGILAQMREILGWIEGLQWQTVPESYACCGFGGLFAVKQPRLSQALGQAYLEAAAATGATALVSNDLSCLLHLQGLLAGRGRSWPIWHLVELLAQAQIT